MSAPLSDLRVLDIATFLAAPFCGTLLADFGAEVIKIEQPESGDSLRRFGSPTTAGDTFVWMSEARNKKSVTLDLRTAEGAELFRELVAKSNVVLENFRPGTLERWGLGFETLQAINPKLVMLSVSGYGQTGPNRNKPGFARVAHAFSGLAYLAGEPGRKPVVPGSTSLADYMSGLFGAVGVLIALRHAERTGRGQVVDIGLYESAFRVLDELAPLYAKNGVVREPMGADVASVVPHSHYPTADGHWVAIACSNERMWHRLLLAMGQPELAADERFATPSARAQHREEVNVLIERWTRRNQLAELLSLCDSVDLPISNLMSIRDIFADPHYAARGNLVQIDDPRVGPITLPAPIPRLSLTPPELRHAGPALGNATEEVLHGLLGVAPPTLASYKARKII